MLYFHLKKYLLRKMCRHEELSRLEKDRADGTLVFVIIATPMLVIVMTMILGIAQAAADTNDLNSYFQRSAQAGVSKVNAYGSLNKNSAIESVLHIQREQTTSNDNTYGNGGDHISSRFCGKPIVNDSGVELSSDPESAYYLEITLNEERGVDTEKGSKASETLVYTGTLSKDANGKDTTKISPTPLSDNRNMGVDSNSRMKVINIYAKVNIRSYWAMPGTDPCRTHTVNVSAITLGSNLDVDYDKDFTTKGFLG